jgi:hypothetical protein
VTVLPTMQSGWWREVTSFHPTPLEWKLFRQQIPAFAWWTRTLCKLHLHMEEHSDLESPMEGSLTLKHVWQKLDICQLLSVRTQSLFLDWMMYGLKCLESASTSHGNHVVCDPCSFAPKMPARRNLPSRVTGWNLKYKPH